MSHFNSLDDAASFLIPFMNGNDYFQDFSLADRVKDDPDGVYAIEAELSGRDGDRYFHGEVVREAMRWFAQATPAERLEAFKLYGREADQDELAAMTV
ncbi:MAG: hypothetical protein RSP_17960 [Rhodanobacter sp.]